MDCIIDYYSKILYDKQHKMTKEKIFFKRKLWKKATAPSAEKAEGADIIVRRLWR